MQSLAAAQLEAALKIADDSEVSAAEKAEMLMEIAMAVQTKPRSTEQIAGAVQLYERALTTCPADQPLLQARISARMGTALQMLPASEADPLQRARACFNSALPVLTAQGTAEEAAEAQMNLGLVLQSLSASGAAQLTEAIQCYHHALRVFTHENWPREFAILHNNLAIAYLSIPLADERAKMREALAVQSFEQVLKVVTIVDQPGEYAMVQNNLGNALQYCSSSHALANNLRALEAYDEALRVRNRRDTPLEYANTIANKANALRNLPDPPMTQTQAQGKNNLQAALGLYEEALAIYREYGQLQNAATVQEMLVDIKLALDGNPLSQDAGYGDGLTLQ